MSALLLLVMGMGGYIFSGIQKGSDAQANEVAEIVARTNRLEISVAAGTARTEAQFLEILRRLDRMEQYIYGSRPSR